MLLYDLGFETLAKTLLYLHADTVAAYDWHGYNLMPGATEIRDPRVSRAVTSGLKIARTRRPTVGTVITDIVVPSLAPIGLSRVVVAVIPEGYVIAHIGDFRAALTDALARKLATEIETWMTERQNPYFAKRPSWTPSPRPRFYPDLSRFNKGL